MTARKPDLGENIRRIRAQSSIERRRRNLETANWLEMFWQARVALDKPGVERA